MDSWSWKLKNCFYNLSRGLSYCALVVLCFFYFFLLFLRHIYCCSYNIYAFHLSHYLRVAATVDYYVCWHSQFLSIYWIVAILLLYRQQAISEWQRLLGLIGCWVRMRGSKCQWLLCERHHHHWSALIVGANHWCTIQIYAFDKRSRSSLKLVVFLIFNFFVLVSALNHQQYLSFEFLKSFICLDCGLCFIIMMLCFCCCCFGFCCFVI